MIRVARAALRTAVDANERSSPVAATIALHFGASQPDLLQEQYAFWNQRTVGTRRGEDRYRWELSHVRVGRAPWCPPRSEWKAWRKREQSVYEERPTAFEYRLTVPISISDGLTLLDMLLNEQNELAPQARDMLTETLRTARGDYASFAQGTSPWEDTFALYCLAVQERALKHLHPFAIAIATSYIDVARPSGLLVGERYPYHSTPLVSASAMLAAGLHALGLELETLASLTSAIAAAQRPNGAWGDEPNDADIFSTLVSARLLSGLDPGFDPHSVIPYFSSAQCADGLWRALGPDAPWMTNQVLELLAVSDKSFSQRFRWPNVSNFNRDPKTGLPSFAYFMQICEFAQALGTLSDASHELAFLDLVGFRAFNNQYGQSGGDRVLAVFAKQLTELCSSIVAIRDGGDEFLLVGAPTGSQMTRAIETLRDKWPTRFRQHFGDGAPVVNPRVITATTTGGALREAREHMGRAVAELKQDRSGDKDFPWKELGILTLP